VDARRAYAEFSRPYVMERLRAICLDVEYVRARGDYVYYLDEAGQEVEVLDFAGGFGATLLGHNHPEIIARAQELLAQGRPTHVQASARALAGQLAERLSERIGRTTGRSYVTTFANSGTEAVEAAIKHAEMERVARGDAVLAGLSQAVHEIRLRLQNNTAHLPDALFADAARVFGLAEIGSLDDLFMRVYRAALDAVETEPVFLAIEGAFHGKTSGAVKLTFNPEYQAPWRRIGPNSVFLPADDGAALGRAVHDATLPYHELVIDEDGSVSLRARTFVNIAGCFVEPIQGEGGVREIGASFLRALRDAADAGGFPLVIDEIQTGCGRTGSFLASAASGVRADYYLFAKALGGGLAKIAAFVADRARYIPEFGFLHSSTYADDDYGSAVALATLDLLDRDDERIFALCREQGGYLQAQLHRLHDLYRTEILDVRGRGLMVGVELAPQRGSLSRLISVLGAQNLLGLFLSGYFLHEARIRVIPTLSARATLRLQPSAFVSREAIDRFCQAFERLLVALRDGDAYVLTRFVVGKSGVAAARASVSTAAPLRWRERAGSAHVGFLAHFLTPADLCRWDFTLTGFTDADCARFLDRTHGVIDPFVAGVTQLESQLGSRVDITIIGIPFLPDQVMAALREGRGDWAVELIRHGVERARRLGCSVVGFGGYTSIITNNCRDIVASDLALTSGNSLTAAAAIEALLLGAQRLGLSERRLGIVGAAGNIGRALAEILVREVDEVVLIGSRRAEKRLVEIASQLGHWASVRVATDVAALRGCNLVVSATNSAQPVIRAEHIAEGAVVICDVAVPRDVHPEVGPARPDAVLLKGGIVQAPFAQSLDVPAMDLRPGEIYGCLAETALLGLASIREHFSYGPLKSADVERMRDLARMHGFAIGENPL
jgi:acetylornithine/succinyldiaminopimelate/putrescine aminotransferase/predicted amino acid dehydrogenase